MLIGNKDFDVANDTYVMGILNVTPDSFSDGGKHNKLDDALRCAEEMIKDGATIIDIGGESTRPGYATVSAEEELSRVIPVVEKLKDITDVPISLDTYKAVVAEEGIKAGIHLVNDVYGCARDDKMAAVIAKYNMPCCLTIEPNEVNADGILPDRFGDIPKDKIILDPGVGFGKDYTGNLVAIKELDKLVAMGYPVLLGTSRKSVIGLTLDVPVDERLHGTVATTVYGVMKGCAFVRVHDVKANYEAIKMTKAIMNV